MITNEIVTKIEREFADRELDLQISDVHEFPVNNFLGTQVGTGYYVNLGEIEFSRGQIDAYVYIEYSDGETTSERLSTPQELELWTTKLTY